MISGSISFEDCKSLLEVGHVVNEVLQQILDGNTSGTGFGYDFDVDGKPGGELLSEGDEIELLSDADGDGDAHTSVRTVKKSSLGVVKEVITAWGANQYVVSFDGDVDVTLRESDRDIKWRVA